MLDILQPDVCCRFSEQCRTGRVHGAEFLLGLLDRCCSVDPFAAESIIDDGKQTSVEVVYTPEGTDHAAGTGTEEGGTED